MKLTEKFASLDKRRTELEHRAFHFGPVCFMRAQAPIPQTLRAWCASVERSYVPAPPIWVVLRTKQTDLQRTLSTVLRKTEILNQILSTVFTFPRQLLFMCMKPPQRQTAAITGPTKGWGAVMRLSVAIVVASVSLIGLSTADEVQGAIRKHTAIPAQGLGPALQQLAKDRDIQFVYRSEIVGDQQTSGAAGDLTFEEALRKLLDGTGLTYEYLENKAITIVPLSTSGFQGAGDNAGEAGVSSSLYLPAEVSRGEARNSDAKRGKSLWDRFRLAQMDDGTEPARPSTGEPVERKSLGTERTVELEEIVVTGSHIRGAGPVGSNIMVIGRDEIDQSGFGRIQDLFETLTQNFTGISEDFNQPNVANQTRGADIQLHGLGPGTTLTLVNGERQPGGGILGAFTDISSIPSSAIERIEILSDGASALYGSDAIGGVVNIILRKDLEGAETRARFSTAGGEADETQVAQLFGTRWSRGHALLGYQYSNRDPLLAKSRPYSAADGDMRGFGGSDLRSTISGDFSNPGNIVNSANQIAYAIPRNQDGRNLTAADLIPGQVNYRDISSKHVLPAQEMHSMFLSLSQDVGTVGVSLDTRYSRRDMNYVAAGTARTVLVPSSNPFYVNPFGGTGPVRVRYNFGKDLGPATEISDTETLTATSQANIPLARDWRLSVGGSYGRETNDWEWGNLADLAAINAAISDTNPATALNVFGDGSHTNPATLEKIRFANFTRAETTAWSAGATVDGPLFALPGGDVRLAAGIDYNDEKLDLESNFSVSGRTESGRSTSAVFAELALPIVGEQQALTGIQSLRVSLAGRYDDYDDFGSTFNPKVGVNWAPVSQVNVRGTWGTSFRAPPFYLSNQDIRPNLFLPLTVTDPKTGRSARVLFMGGQVRPAGRDGRRLDSGPGCAPSPGSETVLHIF